MNISPLISSRNSLGSIYAVGPEKELRVKYDIIMMIRVLSLMVQPVVELVLKKTSVSFKFQNYR